MDTDITLQHSREQQYNIQVPMYCIYTSTGTYITYKYTLCIYRHAMYSYLMYFYMSLYTSVTLLCKGIA